MQRVSLQLMLNRLLKLLLLLSTQTCLVTSVRYLEQVTDMHCINCANVNLQRLIQLCCKKRSLRALVMLHCLLLQFLAKHCCHTLQTPQRMMPQRISYLPQLMTDLQQPYSNVCSRVMQTKRVVLY